MRRRPNGDELDGPLLRVKTAVVTQRIDRETGEWVDSKFSPETQWTVIKRGPVVDVSVTQPVFDVADIPIRVLLRRLVRALETLP